MPVPLIIAGAMGAGAAYKMVKERTGGEEETTKEESATMNWLGGVANQITTALKPDELPRSGQTQNSAVGNTMSHHNDARPTQEGDYRQFIGAADNTLSPQVGHNRTYSMGNTHPLQKWMRWSYSFEITCFIIRVFFSGVG